MRKLLMIVSEGRIQKDALCSLIYICKKAGMKFNQYNNFQFFPKQNIVLESKVILDRDILVLDQVIKEEDGYLIFNKGMNYFNESLSDIRKRFPKDNKILKSVRKTLERWKIPLNKCLCIIFQLF